MSKQSLLYEAAHTNGTIRFLKSEVSDALTRGEHRGDLLRVYDDSMLGVYACTGSLQATRLLNGRQALPFDMSREIALIDHTLMPDKLRDASLIVYRHLTPDVDRIDPKVAYLLDPRNTVVVKGVIRLRERLDVAVFGEASNGLSQVVKDIHQAYARFDAVVNGNGNTHHSKNGKGILLTLEKRVIQYDQQLLLFTD